MSERDAVMAGDAGMGPPRASLWMLRPLVAAGAFATALIALWLGFVIIVVLPARDPAHIWMWATTAVAFLAYAALTLTFAVRGPQPPWLRSAVVVASIAAMAFGAWEILAMVTAARTGAHFEGYLLLVGAILAAQGLCAFAYVMLTVAISRRVRAS